jgi:hypothetical protein
VHSFTFFSSSQNSTPSTEIPTLQNPRIHTTSTTRTHTYMHASTSIHAGVFGRGVSTVIIYNNCH